VIETVLERLALPRGRARHRARRLRLGPRGVIALALAVALLVAAWMWLRDSSLVAVTRVTIVGVSGPDAHRIRAALKRAALNMTTLDVKQDALSTAVEPYPVVKAVRADAQFPHGLRIRVTEQIPVAALVGGGRPVAVAADGTLLHDVPVSGLPAIPVGVPPAGTLLRDRSARAAVDLLAAAPDALASAVAQVTTSSGHGLEVQLRNGPSVYFGDTSRVAAKWIALTKVLADAGAKGASYIDVTDPERPAAGGASGAGAGGGSGAVGSAAGAAGAAGSAGAAGASSGSAGASGGSAGAIGASAGATGGAAGTAGTGAAAAAGGAAGPTSTSSSGG
jgi:cell division septal protein FtsQ